MQQENYKKILVLRLSSLGDIVLASSVLNTQKLKGGVDWVIAKEYCLLLDGHPCVKRLWSFDRHSGFYEWYRFCRLLWEYRYDEVLDLHRSLRTGLMRFFFMVWSIREKRQGARWTGINKERLRLYSYFFLKKALPEKYRPRSQITRYLEVVGGAGTERPNLQHVFDNKRTDEDWMNKPFICVMPASLWRGKRWPVSQYLKVVKNIGLMPVVLGSSSDQESSDLVSALEAESISHVSGVGKWDLRQVAWVLAHSAVYLGNDTGLAHLAEAVGTPAFVIYGPTTSDMGFGAWRPNSRAIEGVLWCRPCGKDGRYCFRIWRRFVCQEGVTAEKVISFLHEIGGRAPCE
jgi:heptosyltransferase II